MHRPGLWGTCGGQSPSAPTVALGGGPGANRLWKAKDPEPSGEWRVAEGLAPEVQGMNGGRAGHVRGGVEAVVQPQPRGAPRSAGSALPSEVAP